jgi:class 3 adenylate cyclase
VPLLDKARDERKLVTILFADISGFTAMAETMDPEEVRDMLNDCFEKLVPVIEKFEGTVEKFIGDEIMAMFGAPVMHENDAERALQTALEMQTVLADYNAESGMKLDLHFGINTGLVIAGGVGARGRKEYAVTGDAVNLAARLEGASERGEILVGESTHRLTAALFEFEPLAPMRLKGKAEPLQVYRLLGAKSVSNRARALSGLESSLVGREAEAGALLDAVERLRSGMGGIVTLVGEAGLGKSRLVAETRKQTLAEPARARMSDGASPDPPPPEWVEGRCVSLGSSVAYLLWLELLKKLSGVRPEDPALAVRDILQQKVRELCPDQFEDVFPYLARLMSLPLGEEVEAWLRGLGGQGLKSAFCRAMHTFIDGAARQRGPLVLVCEDLHWADPSSLELLETLLPLTDQAPLLLVCLFRPETEHGCWHIKEIAARRHRHRYTDLWLEPLSLSESRRLVDNLLDEVKLPAPLFRKILEHGEGNPFYVEELIRSLIADGIIAWDKEAAEWRAVGSAVDIHIPPTLHAVLMARIDHLEDETKRILQLAAVVGRVFQQRVLEATAGWDCRLDGHLLNLEREELIHERARIPEREYIFKHQLTQEAAYASLLNKERRAIHLQVARVLEQTAPERVEERLELLAEHWERAAEAEKATHYWIRAGKKATARYANTEARAHFDRALALSEGKETYDEILALRARVLLDLFKGKPAADDYQQLLDRSQQRGDQRGEVEASLGLAAAYYSSALDDRSFAKRSLACYERAYTLAAELGDKVGMVRALIATVWFPDYWPEYRPQAVANIKKAWSISEQTGDETLILDCMLARASNDLISIDQVEDLLTRLEERHDLPRLKNAYFRLIWRHLLAGNFLRCIECCEVSSKLAVQLGVPPAMYSTQKALALLNLGRYAEARASLEEEIAGADYPFSTSLKGFGEGMYYLSLMVYDRAEKIFLKVIKQADDVGRAWLRLWAKAGLTKALLGRGRVSEVSMDWIREDLEGTGTELAAEAPELLGEIALAQGDLDEALAQAERGRVQAEQNGWRPCCGSLLELQLRILIRAGRSRDAIVLAEEGRQMAEEMGYRPLTWRFSYAKAQALEMEHRAKDAAESFQAAANIIRELVAAIDDDELKRQFMEHPLVGQALARGEHRETRTTKE